ERNAAPEIHCLPSFARVVEPSKVDLLPGYGLRTSLEFGAPIGEWLGQELLRGGVDIAMPSPRCTVPAPQQPYRIVFIGEKVSLKPVLRPIAQRIHAELI